jgi:tRNA modification GTPase
VALVGRPNAGKSTLLNRLAGMERAVVSDIAGTTRDALSARVTLRRGTITLVDLAGLEREPLPSSSAPASEIERAMRETALREAGSADVLVLLRECGDERPVPDLPRKPDLFVHSKADLHRPRDHPPSDHDALCISAVTGEGMESLVERLDAACFGPLHVGDELLAMTTRHVQAVEQARAALARADALADGSPELVALELREALDQLGSILGMVSPDELLGRVFSKFCIGK